MILFVFYDSVGSGILSFVNRIIGHIVCIIYHVIFSSVFNFISAPLQQLRVRRM